MWRLRGGGRTVSSSEELFGVGLSLVAHWAMLRKHVAVWDVLTALVYKGQAVKTMGWDAVLSVVVYGVLHWGGGV